MNELDKKICAKIAYYDNVGVGEWMTCSREIINLCMDTAIPEIIDELRNRKGFRRWWDDCDFQDDVIDSLQNRLKINRDDCA